VLAVLARAGPGLAGMVMWKIHRNHRKITVICLILWDFGLVLL